MFRFEFINSQDKPVYLQVDPWACLYRLNTGESIEIVAHSECKSPSVSFEEYDSGNRILTLWDCKEFFVVKEGKQVHWTQYQTNET